MKNFKDPFATKGVWLKGNTHAHTTMSDGLLEPEALIDRYQKVEYDFLTITDHRVTFDSTKFKSRDMILLNGIEFHPDFPNDVVPMCWHLVAIGCDADEGGGWNSCGDAQKDLDVFLSQGAFTILCHPYWCGFEKKEMELLKNIHALEVYNHVCEVDFCKGDSTNEYDAMLAWGERVSAVACDDCHNDQHLFGGWIMLKAQEKSPAAILEALKSGCYYATMGPEFFQVRWDGDNLTVLCSPVRSIKILGPYYNSGPHHIAKKNSSLTDIQITMKEKPSYLRVQIEDHQGRRAWTQPVFFDQLSQDKKI